MATWADLDAAEPDLAATGEKLLLNCGPDWGVALLGTIKSGGGPRISPLCVYVVDHRLLVTVEGLKAQDLDRDARCFLHTYWSEGQDEFAIEATASPPLTGDVLEDLVNREPRLQWCAVRELSILSAHSVIYRNFPAPDMYAEVTVWKPDKGSRRWTRDEGSGRT